MDIWSAIKGRRSIGVVKPDPIPREMIEKILDAATWAPTHHMTEPWRFFVLTGKARERLGEFMASVVRETCEDPDAEECLKQAERVRSHPLRAPVVIAAAVSPAESEKVVEIEEVEAVACAIQNMLLAAHALGLGAVWRTGAMCYEPKMKEFFGLGERERLAGFVYIGYPDMEKKGVRRPFAEKTVWMDE